MSNLFNKAQATSKPAAPKKGTQKFEVEMKGVARLAKIAAAIETLQVLHATADAELKSSSFNQFMELGSNGVRPSSFEATDGTAKASMQLKTRSSASGFNDEELALLGQHNVVPAKNVAVQKMFGINPKYSANEELLGAVSKAIEALVPADFIVMQEEKSKSVSSDVIVAEAFKNKLPAEVIKVLTTQACRATLGVEADVVAILAEVSAEIKANEEASSEKLVADLQASIKKVK